MIFPQNGKVTLTQVLLPVSLIAFVLFIMLAFQTSQILRERSILNQARAQQDQPIEQAQKVQTQLDALAVGTLKLSEKGNKNAKAIIERMKKLGITVNPDKNGAMVPAAADVPAAEPAADDPAMEEAPQD